MSRPSAAASAALDDRAELDEPTAIDLADAAGFRRGWIRGVPCGVVMGLALATLVWRMT